MSRSVLVVALVLSCLAASPGPASAVAQSDAHYACNGTSGVLSIHGCNEEWFVARDVTGNVVAQGVVMGTDFMVPASNSGCDASGNLLFVVVGDKQAVFSMSHPIWIWE